MPIQPGKETDVRMRGFANRTDLDQAIAIVHRLAQPREGERVSIRDAAGRVLAEPVVAEVPVPGFARSAMDGYAVRGEETFGASLYNPLTFQVVGQSMPGRPFEGQVESGQAVRIMTGAPVPHGADAVVMAEYATEIPGIGQSQVAIVEPIAPGRNVGLVGEDIEAGTTVLTPRRLLRPQDAGLLASIGKSHVQVIQRPRVQVVITGDELLPAGSVPAGVRIVDSNSLMLEALVRRDGGVPESGEIVPDERECVRQAMCERPGDVVLVSGGSSVGTEDYAPTILAESGELLVHGIAMRPSSPAGFGRIQGRLVFLLPGNPVSCLAAYDFLAGPAIRLMGGRHPQWPYRTTQAPLAAKIASALGRVDYCRVRVTERGVEPMAISGASILSSTTRADGIVVVPRDSEGHSPGEQVTVYLYD